jgi:UDP-glucose 4-epimerase
LAAEAYCDAFAGSYGLRTTSLRFSNVYGPRSEKKTSVIAAFLRAILEDRPVTVFGDGSQVRDYVFVSDVCRAITLALNSGVDGTFHIGSGEGTSINALLKIIENIVGPQKMTVQFAPARSGEVHTTYADITRAGKLLGYSPCVPLSEGIQKTWAWLKDWLEFSCHD